MGTVVERFRASANRGNALKPASADQDLGRTLPGEPQAAEARACRVSHSSPQIITACPGETSRYWRAGGT